MKNKYFIFIFMVILSSCNVKFFEEKVAQNEDLPDSVIGDFKYLSLNVFGEKEWELKASEAKMYDDKDEVYLFNLTMTMYNESNQAKSFLSGDSGFIEKSDQNIMIEGHVKILSDNGVTLEADRVYWDNESEQFYTDTNELVVMTRGNTIINGYNLVADSELEQVTLENVTANVRR